MTYLVAMPTAAAVRHHAEAKRTVSAAPCAPQPGLARIVTGVQPVSEPDSGPDVVKAGAALQSAIVQACGKWLLFPRLQPQPLP